MTDLGSCGQRLHQTRVREFFLRLTIEEGVDDVLAIPFHQVIDVAKDSTAVMMSKPWSSSWWREGRSLLRTT